MEIDMLELRDFICKKTGLSEDIVDSILEMEMEFLESKGLVGERPENENFEIPFVDTDDLQAFIVGKLKLSKENVSTVLDLEDEFLASKGVIETKNV